MLNFLANYKSDSGFGAQVNLLVTAPIEISQSGWLDVPASQANWRCVADAAAVSNGYWLHRFKRRVIPWQYTINTALSYNFMKNYQVKFSIYNLTNQRNLTTMPRSMGTTSSRLFRRAASASLSRQSSKKKSPCHDPLYDEPQEWVVSVSGFFIGFPTRPW